MQLSNRQDHPWFGQNLDWKTALRWAQNTPAAFVSGTVSLEPKLDFMQVHNFKKEGIASFPTILRSSKFDIGSYVNHARENWWRKGD